jgi:hypothetical protein
VTSATDTPTPPDAAVPLGEDATIITLIKKKKKSKKVCQG